MAAINALVSRAGDTGRRTSHRPWYNVSSAGLVVSFVMIYPDPEAADDLSDFMDGCQLV